MMNKDELKLLFGDSYEISKLSPYLRGMIENASSSVEEEVFNTLRYDFSGIAVKL